MSEELSMGTSFSRAMVLAGVAVGLLLAGAWALKAGLDGLAYQREWPTMSDGTVARTQLTIGILLLVAATVSAWGASRARRRR